jgi:Outer membrane protein
MKSISTILSIIALVLVAVLFYLHFNTGQKQKQTAVPVENKPAGSFKIAYFDIDSLQEHYLYYKDVLEKIKRKENSMNNELNDMTARYQKKIREWQEKGNTMTQSEGEAAQREYGMMQQRYQEKKTELEQALQKEQVDGMQELRKQVENFLKEYNQTKGYAYILSYEPGFIIYYKDSAYNITKDLIDGLNARYKENKEKKK